MCVCEIRELLYGDAFFPSPIRALELKLSLVTGVFACRVTLLALFIIFDI